MKKGIYTLLISTALLFTGCVTVDNNSDWSELMRRDDYSRLEKYNSLNQRSGTPLNLNTLIDLYLITRGWQWR